MNEQVFHKLRLNEWQHIQTKAKALWTKNHLGTKPTYEEVKKTLPNQHSITPLEWMAMLVLVVLTAFTSYKVGALAIPFSERTLETLSDHTYMAQWVKDSFTVVTAVLFMLLATPSVIYFKLLSKEPEIAAEKKETKTTGWLGRWQLDYLTPRLPALIVYLSVGWLVYLSSQLPGTVFEQYLPVFVEVGLAALVGNILRKRQEFGKVVAGALKEKVDPYEARLKGYETDGAYLRTLYQVMREDVASILRPEPNGRRNYKANAWMDTAEDNMVFRMLSAEYKRLTSGDQFANAVQNQQSETPVEDAPAEIRTTQRMPPAGDATWSVDTLLHDLRVRGIDPAQGYSEGQLLRDYAPNHDARKAWRDGARDQFLGSK